jgi:hypothetical protein
MITQPLLPAKRIPLLGLVELLNPAGKPTTPFITILLTAKPLMDVGEKN